MSVQQIVLVFVDKGCTDNELSFRGEFIPDMIAERMKSIGLECIFSIPDTYRGRLSGKDRCHSRSGADDVNFWKGLFATNDASAIISIQADSPFVDPLVVREMADLHVSSLAEFTFSENLPLGCACEVVSRELIEAIPSMDAPTLALGQVVRSNLNGFDAEIYYRDPDIRHLRISFLNRDPRVRRIMEQIVDIGNKFPLYDELLPVLEQNPSLLSSGPSYLEVELTGRCDYNCLFCYRKTLNNVHGDMTVEFFRKLLSYMREFSLPYTLCLGGSGEPLLHPSFYNIADMALSEELVERVIVETNGLLADENYVSYARSKGNRLNTIINMNGCDSDTYRSLHGYDGFDRVSKNIDALKETGSPLYIQVMKIKETEPFLDRYYDFWEPRGVTIILQKQNTYLGRIEDRRYSDLTPIERGFCWHLTRDLFVLSDGSVGFCKQDICGDHARGNVMDTSLREIWEKQKKNFISNFKCEFAEKPDCRNCDEWYTFNC